ncbi:MAG: TonB-dependent receptor [Cyclobacteriaceae bacterium]
MKKNLLIILLGLTIYQQAQSQDESDLFDLSLEELMNIEIVSASRQAESLFEAPVSSYSITREEIDKSGAISIPEALRLCPGVIVREMTNGNYDIHLRGFDNVKRYATRGSQINSQALLMIDNRPVFNYSFGGIFWEALSVDLIDVERIEVVRGPSAPLFGPNAVTGVINIITRKAKKVGWYSKANVQYGTPETLIGNLAIGQKFNDKTSVIFSGNYQQRHRHDDLYYAFESDQYLENVDAIPNNKSIYPQPKLALARYGVNAFVNHKVNDQIEVDLSAGLLNAEAQRKLMNDITSLGFNGASSQYINLAGQVYGVSAKISFTHGHDNFYYHNAPLIAREFDYEIVDVVLDYPWQVTDKLLLLPSVNFQSATSDDSKYVSKSLAGGLFNREVTLSGIAGSLRTDYQFTDSWRLIGSVRADKFAKPNEVYISYQFASTYNLSDKFLFRAAYSKSSSSAFAIYTSTNFVVNQDLALNGPGTGPVYQIAYLGNENYHLPSAKMAEIGMRVQLTKNLQFDFELFQQQMEDFSSYVLSEYTYQPSGLPTPYPPVVPATEVNSIENFPMKAVQRGLTISANYVYSSKFQFKPFVTIQRTEVADFPLALNTLPTDPDTNPANLYNGVDEEHPSTPKVYGGLFLQGTLASRLQASISAYFYSAHTQFDQADADYQRNSKAGEIDGKLLLNSKISYQLIDQLKIYLNVRNILDNDRREYYGSDRIGRTIFAGSSFSL